MIKGSKHLATVKPLMKHLAGTATTAVNEILMDWHPFQVPRGGCRIKSLHATIAGTNGSAVGQENQQDLTVLFARSIDGVAPPKLGASNAVADAISMTAARPHIVGNKYLQPEKMDKVTGSLFNDDLFHTYRMIDINAKDADFDEIAIMMAGNPSDYIEKTENKYNGAIDDSITGYQTMWIAVISMEAGHDFGTGCLLDMAAGSTPGALANDPTGVTQDDDNPAVGTIVPIGLSGTDARLCFAPGDFIGDASAAAKVIGKVVKVVSATEIHVDFVREIVAHGAEIVNLAPITFHFGLEY